MKCDYGKMMIQADFQDIISPLFDISLNKDNKNNSEEIARRSMEQLNNLDIAMYCETGMPRAELIVTDDCRDFSGRYTNVNGKHILIFNTRYCRCGIEYLVTYLHEKYHEFQIVSLMTKNKDVDPKVLEDWKMAHKIHAKSADSDSYLNAIERDAYGEQYKALLILKAEFKKGYISAPNRLHMSAEDKKSIEAIFDHEIEHIGTIVQEQEKEWAQIREINNRFK